LIVSSAPGRSPPALHHTLPESIAASGTALLVVAVGILLSVGLFSNLLSLAAAWSASVTENLAYARPGATGEGIEAAALLV
jgi:hypothetical protein